MRNPIQRSGVGPLTGKDLLAEYATYSATASTINRQAALAGIAIAWLFRVTLKGAAVDRVLLPAALVVPILIFVLAVLVDVAQYAYETVVHMHIATKLEGHNIEDRVTTRADLHDLTEALWTLKIVLVPLGYITLAVAVWADHLLAFAS